MTHDWRRLRVHGVIERIPKIRRYRVTDRGLQHALLCTHAHDHLLRTGLAACTSRGLTPSTTIPLKATQKPHSLTRS
jgi:hypothetical protein